MATYHFRPGDDGNDPVPIAQLLLGVILTAVIIFGVIKLYGLGF